MQMDSDGKLGIVKWTAIEERRMRVSTGKNIATVDALLESAKNDSAPPTGLSEELQALWHTKKGNWEEAHGIAQEISSSWGSWMHAHLHLIEGDRGNAGYWYARAGKQAGTVEGLEAEWRALAGEILGE
jgi:hypothetical protein